MLIQIVAEITQGLSAANRERLETEAAQRAHDLQAIRHHLEEVLANYGRDAAHVEDALGPYEAIAVAIVRRTVCGYLELCERTRKSASTLDDRKQACDLAYYGLLCSYHALLLLPPLDDHLKPATGPTRGHPRAIQQAIIQQQAPHAGGPPKPIKINHHFSRAGGLPQDIPEAKRFGALTIILVNQLFRENRFKNPPEPYAQPEWRDGPNNRAMALELLARRDDINVLAITQRLVRTRLPSGRQRHQNAGGDPRITALERTGWGADTLTLETLAICDPPINGGLVRVLDEPVPVASQDDIDAQLDSVASAATESLQLVDDRLQLMARVLVLTEPLALGPPGSDLGRPRRTPRGEPFSNWADAYADARRGSCFVAPHELLIKDGSVRMDVPAGWAVLARIGTRTETWEKARRPIQTTQAQRDSIAKAASTRNRKAEILNLDGLIHRVLGPPFWLASVPEPQISNQRRGELLGTTARLWQMLYPENTEEALHARRTHGHHLVFDGSDNPLKADAAMRMLLAYAAAEALIV